jgi:L-ascorbate metabolism protein UlaG (beta-lactamase superfamily)
MPTLAVRLVGGPTAELEYAGVRFLTDPALSPPGEYAGLTKVTGPAVDVTQSDPFDVVLLSHDQHSDNLDPGGREFLASVGQVLTTVEGAHRLGGNATGLEPWADLELSGRNGQTVTVTAVPAQHGPDGSDEIQGQVHGFLLSSPGAETVYVSGDNASLDVVRAISDRAGEIAIAVLFAGAVQLARKFDGAYLTLSSDHAADAAKILGVRAVVPVHFEGWTHFTQNADSLVAAFAGNGIPDLLVLLEPGQRAEL